jgi:micrococcal nuclease
MVMPRVIALFLVALLLNLSPAWAEPVSLVVESIEDGDTLVARVNGSAARLQLSGIDAPEDTENAKLKRDMQTSGLEVETLLALGVAATQHLSTLVKSGDRIKVEGALDKPDRYGRIPVMVYDESGRVINDAMIEDGYAVVLRYGKLDGELKSRLEGMEAEAIAARRGLWGEKRADALAWSGHESKR